MSRHKSEIWADIQEEFSLEFFTKDRAFYDAVAGDIGRKALTDSECAAVYNIRLDALTDLAINGKTHPKSHWPLIEQVTWLRVQMELPTFSQNQAG